MKSNDESYIKNEELLAVPDVTNEEFAAYLNECFDGLKSVYVLDTAIELNVFDKTQNIRACDELCDELGIERMTGKLLLDCLANMGLLYSDDGSYVNTPIAEDFLCTDSPMKQFRKIGFIFRNLEHWQNLTGILKDGQPIQKVGEIFKPEKLPMMLESNLGGSVGLVLEMLEEKIDLDSIESVMGIGAGALQYLLGFTHEYPGIKGAVIEREAFLQPGTEMIEKYGNESVEMVVGDYKRSLEGTYDLVFTSLTHAALETDIAESISAGLNPGGYFVVRRNLPEVSMDPFRDLDINLTRLEIIPKGVLHHHGDEHAVEYIENLGKTGVHLIDRFDFLEGSEVLIFRKDQI